MKIISLASLLFLSIALFSCNNDDSPENPDFISSKINEVQWKGLPEVYLNQANGTLTILGVGSEQVVVFKLKFAGEGVYNLSENQVVYYTTIGGDVITSLYSLDASKSSNISITQYSSDNNIIKGNFEFSVLQDWSNPENDEELLSFTNGEFKGVIIYE